MRKTAKSVLGAAMALVIVLSVIIGCGMLLLACKSKNEKDIADVQVNNLDTYYLADGEIDLDAVTLTVTYDDGTTDEYRNKEYDIKDKEAKDGTEFILNTSGLYGAVSRGNVAPGNYSVSYSIPSYKKSGEWGTVTVVKDYSSELFAVLYEAPEQLSVYSERYDAAAEDYEAGKSMDETNEEWFFKAPDGYFVGDDNEFVFKPTLSVVSRNTGTAGTFSGYDKDITVTHVTDSGTVYLDDSEYFSVSEKGFGVQFTEKAVGETFIVKISAPKGLEYYYDDGDEPVPEYSMEVTVADGWNVYSAMDLGMMNLTSSGFDRKEYTIDGDYNQQLTGKFYWDAESETLVAKNPDEIWSGFLKENGNDVSSPVNGLYLQGDISVRNRDFPEDFVITESEAKHNGCNYDEMIGSVRDGVKLYEKYMEDGDFTLGGNLFTVDCSSLKWAMTFVDTNGNFDHYPEAKTDVYRGGRLSLFAVQGKVDDKTDADSRPTAYFENLGGVGNAIDPDDTDGKEAGSFCFVQSLTCKTVADNCHVRNFLYGFRGDDSGDGYVNLTVRDTKVYDNYFSALRICRSARNEVYESYFKRFSGPAIFQMSETEERGTEQFGEYYECGITIDDDSVLENYIDGSEAWFVSSNATNIATYINMANGLVEVCSGYTKTGVKDGKINLRCVQHDTDDFGWGGKRLNTSYKTGENGVPFVLNETTLTPAEGGGHVETLDGDFDGDLSLYNAASVNYFVDGVPSGSFTPIPALFGTNGGTLVAIDNSYEGFYDPAMLRDLKGDAYLYDDEGNKILDEKGKAIAMDSLSFEATATELYIYYRMDGVSDNDGTGLCLIVELFDMDKASE